MSLARGIDLIIYVISGRAAPGQEDEASEFVSTLVTYFPGASIFADEPDRNQVYVTVPFPSLADYEEHMAALTRDVAYQRLVRDGWHRFEPGSVGFRILRQRAQ